MHCITAPQPRNVSEPTPSASMTNLFGRIRTGDAHAREELFTVVYENLRQMARSRLAGHNSEDLLQPTALVNEAWMKLDGPRSAHWQDRVHFMKLASIAMRTILADHARARHAQKRDPGGKRVALDGIFERYDHRVGSILDLDEALTMLAQIKQRYVDVIELRFFGGLSLDDVGRSLGISERQARRDWKFARAWLRTKLDANS